MAISIHNITNKVEAGVARRKEERGDSRRES